MKPSDTTGAQPSGDHTSRAARTALILLLAINLFNYVDRQVLAAVVPDLRRVFFSGATHDGFTATLMGWFETHLHFRPENALIGMLSMAFMTIYMVGAPIFARLSEKWSRWSLVGAAVIIWSLASGASGLAITFGMLLLIRCFVGIGEAAYAPTAQSMLSDLFPLERRGRVLAWFNMAIPVGSALGFVLGGFMANHWPGIGWRWAFLLSLPPGIILGALAIWRGRKERLAKRAALAAATTAPKPAAARPCWRDYRELFLTPSYLLCTAGMCATTFAIGGIGFWMVDYMQTTRGAGANAATIFGLILVVAGFSATMAGGMLGDRLSRRWPGAYFTVSGVGMILGFPIFLLVISPATTFPLAWIYLFITCFCLFFNTGPVNAILANVTRPALRPMAFAVNILVIHALGDVPSPMIIGLITDRCHGDMNIAFRFVAALFIVGGACWMLGARFLARDMARHASAVE